MKRRLRHITLLFMAAIIFFVGAGITIVELCCSDCMDSVLTMQYKGDECDMTSNTDAMSCCADQGHHAENKHETHDADGQCCGAKRLDMSDMSNAIFKPDLSALFAWPATPLFQYLTLDASAINNLYSDEGTRDSVPIPPRSYLSLIRILII